MVQGRSEARWTHGKLNQAVEKKFKQALALFWRKKPTQLSNTYMISTSSFTSISAFSLLIFNIYFLYRKWSFSIYLFFIDVLFNTHLPESSKVCTILKQNTLCCVCPLVLSTYFSLYLLFSCKISAEEENKGHLHVRLFHTFYYSFP